MNQEIQTIQELLNKKPNAEFTYDQTSEQVKRLINILKVLAQIKSENSEFPTSSALSSKNGECSHAW